MRNRALLAIAVAFVLCACNPPPEIRAAFTAVDFQGNRVGDLVVGEVYS